MTEYNTLATIVCPEAMIPDANQLGLVLGERATDDQTFGAARYHDTGGNLYAVSSTVATATFAGTATSPMSAPAHSPNADLTAAGRAQAALYIHGAHGTDGAAPGRLWALVEAAPGDALAALTLAGVAPVPDEGLV